MRQFGYILLFLIFSVSKNYAQKFGQVVNDTLYVNNEVNKPIEVSKAIGKYVYIANIVPEDLPEKVRKVQIISSKSTEIDTRKIQIVDNKHFVIPFELLTEKYYTIYFKKGQVEWSNKKLIVR